GLVVDRFGARIDQQRERAGVLHPGRDQPPAHQRELALAVYHAHDRDRLGRCHVVARRGGWLLGVAEQPPKRFRRGSDQIASTHVWAGLTRSLRSASTILRRARLS